MLLERGLSLIHGGGVIEIPDTATWLLGRRLGNIALRGPVVGDDIVEVVTAHLPLFGFLLGLFPPLLLLFLLQLLDHTVDGSIAVFFTHLGQCLQGVLQMDGLGVGNEFVEYLRTR